VPHLTPRILYVGVGHLQQAVRRAEQAITLTTWLLVKWQLFSQLLRGLPLANQAPGTRPMRHKQERTFGDACGPPDSNPKMFR